MQHTIFSRSTASRPGDASVGVFFPRRCGDRASDTPVANSASSRLIRLRGCCHLAASLDFWSCEAGRRKTEPAKLTVDAVS